MLQIHHSNRLHNLIDRLADNLRTSPAPSLEPETILVQSNGMKRWVSMELARRLGIAAHLDFPYPASFIWRTYQALIPELPDASAFSQETLVWRLLTCFEALDNDPIHAPLHSYLQDADACERYQLACQIADVFDRYLVYRPDWISRWEENTDAHHEYGWQTALWRHLVKNNGWHRVRVQQLFSQRLDSLDQRPAAIPARLSCIGIASLPASQLHTLLQLTRFCHMDFYLLNPCRQYWGMIMAEREIAKYKGEHEAEDLYLETGNRLLASWGRQGRDFHHVLTEVDAAPVELFEDIPEDTLLHCLQHDILDLQNRGDNHTVCRFDTYSRPHDSTPLAPSDHSLQIHICHSPMREVEVLYDQLLGLFCQHPSLKASDIVVMTPDIDAYAPSIQAVFATAEPHQRIPFSIADRGFHTEKPVLNAFLTLLALPNSRFDVNQVLTLLEMPAIRQRFELYEEDLPLIGEWLRQTAVRWGVDGQGRAALALPATDQHTWKAGLQRLLLGFALPGKERQLFGTILPFDAMEGQGARVMGRLRRFTRKLFQLNECLDADRTIQEWCTMLQRLFDDFIALDEDTVLEWESLRDALAELCTSATQAEYSGELPLAVVRAWLDRFLAGRVAPAGFIGAGVTFCTLLPMRSIPFKVVCVIGLNDGVYPRPQPLLDFDLMTRYPRRGDRARRSEDRYLFLEALLSAQDVFYLSYVGSSIRDNNPIPPSVLVSELMDYLRQGFYPRDNPAGDPLDCVVTRHPLQPFSRRYFAASATGRLFSYSAVFCAAAQTQGQKNSQPPPLFTAPLSEPDSTYRSLDLETLTQFFQHPCRFLLQRRLGVELQEGAGLLETREPFVLERFAASAIRKLLFDLQQEGQTPADIFPLVEAKGLLPHGQMGRALYAREVGKVKSLFKVWEQLAGWDTGKLPLTLDHSGFEVTGWLTSVAPQGLLTVHTSSLSARHFVDLWLRHVLLNCVKPAGVGLETTCWGLDGGFSFAPLEHPEAVLDALLALYWQGLQKPLKFFPYSSWVFVQAIEKKEKKDPFQLAQVSWEGSDRAWGDAMDAYNHLIFRDHSPITQEFADLAQQVFTPLLAHRRELS